MFTLIGVGMVAMAIAFMVLGLVALLRCDRAAIPETVRALSSWLRYSYSPISSPTGRDHAAAWTDDAHPGIMPLKKAGSLEQS